MIFFLWIIFIVHICAFGFYLFRKLAIENYEDESSSTESERRSSDIQISINKPDEQESMNTVIDKIKELNSNESGKWDTLNRIFEQHQVSVECMK